MPQGAISVQNLRQMNRALARADKQVKADARKIMREVAEPVASAAEQLALSNIRNMTPAWAKNRIGVTQKLIYVVPAQRGRNTKRNPGRYRRPNLGRLLVERAYDPARERYAPFFEREFERAMDKMARQFNHGV
jgi:hypothetical protein